MMFILGFIAGFLAASGCFIYYFVRTISSQARDTSTGSPPSEIENARGGKS